MDGDMQMFWQIILKNTRSHNRRQLYWTAAMPTTDGGSDKLAMSTSGHQRDAAEYITGALGLSKTRLNGDQYGPRIFVLVEHTQASRMGLMLSGCARPLCSHLVIWLELWTCSSGSLTTI